MSFDIDMTIGPGPRRERANVRTESRLRVCVVGDFSGHESTERPPLAARVPMRVDVDRLDAVFSRMAPQVELGSAPTASGPSVRLALAQLDDLQADALAARLAPAAEPTSPAPAKAGAGTRTPEPSAPPPGSAAPADEDAAATLRRLLGGEISASPPARAEAAPAAQAGPAAVVDRFIRDVLARQAPAHPASNAPAQDAAAHSRLRTALRDVDWRRAEMAWRAVDAFVRQLDTAGSGVELALLDMRADELLQDLSAAPNPADSRLGRVLRGAGPWDLVVSLETFGPSLAELALLAGLAGVAACLDALVLAAAAPGLVTLATSSDAEVSGSVEARSWVALRASPLALHTALTFPRILARLPYGLRGEPCADKAFDELADGVSHERLAWRSAALDVARLLAEGWCARGDDSSQAPPDRLEDLPAFVDHLAAEPALQPVAEAWLGEREVAALVAGGFIVLESDRRVPAARVAEWRSLGAGEAPLRRPQGHA